MHLSLGFGEFDPFFADGHEISVGGPTTRTIASAIVSMSDGSAYVAGYRDSQNTALVTRITFDGVMDTTFGAGGLVSQTIPTVRVVGAAVQPDGKLAVASWSRAPGETWDYSVFRVTQQGALDGSFGLRTIDFSGNKDMPTGLLAEPDGKLVIFGWSYNGNKAIASMAGLNNDGSLDPGFGTGGKVLLDLGLGQGSQFSGGTLLPDGKILLVGSGSQGIGAPSDLMLARFLPNGQPDASFGAGGLLFMPMSRPFAASVVTAPGGGFFVAVGDVSVALLKFDAQGTLDTSFGQSGSAAVFPSAYNADTSNSLAVQSDGSILVSCNAGGGWELARVLPSGQLDLAFGTSGTGIVQRRLGNYGQVGNVAVQPDGRALIGGGWVDNLSGLTDGLIVARYQTEPLANQAYFNSSTGNLNVFGTEDVDSISVDSVDADHANVTVNGQTFPLTITGLKRIDLRLFGNDDVLALDSSVGPVKLFMGAGNDTLTFAASSGRADSPTHYKVFGNDGNDRLNLSGGNGAVVEFDGSAGTDIINFLGTSHADVASFRAGQLNAFGYTVVPSNSEALTVDAGDGDDLITTDANVPIPTTVSAGAGDDEFDFVLPSNSSSVSLLLDGGDGTDIVKCVGSAFADVMGLNGAVVSYAAQSATMAQTESALFDGGSNGDTFTLAGNVSMAVTVDGGTGNDKLTISGTSFDDLFELHSDWVDAPTVQPKYAQLENLVLSGGSGNDTFTLSGFAPGCAVTALGGAGNDVLNLAADPTAGADFQGGTDLGSTHTLNILVGTYTFNADARNTTAGLSVSVASPASAVFRASQHLTSLSVDGGIATLDGPGNLFVRTTQLAIGYGGKLDLKSNALIDDYTGLIGPLLDVLAMLVTGRNGGTWDGLGISSSVVAANPGTALGLSESSMIYAAFPALFVGESIDSTALLIRYTLQGDATLDRTVDIKDLYALSANWKSFNRVFGQGDFNYDGRVDAADLGILSSHWQQTLPPPPPASPVSVARAPMRTATRIVSVVP